MATARKGIIGDGPVKDYKYTQEISQMVGSSQLLKARDSCQIVDVRFW